MNSLFLTTVLLGLTETGMVVGLLFIHLFTSVLLNCPNDLEFALFSVVNPGFSYKVHVGLIYRPPSASADTLGLSCSSLQNVNVHGLTNFVLLVDFNVNFYNPSHPLFSNLCNILDCLSLSQVVYTRTHPYQPSRKCIPY